MSSGGQESECGWRKDRWGISWQITPRELQLAERTDRLAKSINSAFDEPGAGIAAADVFNRLEQQFDTDRKASSRGE